MKFLAVFLAIFVANISGAEFESPCPNIFKYDITKKEKAKWFGELNLDSEYTLNGLWIRVVLDQKAELSGDKPFEVRTEDNISFLVKSPDTVLKAGSPVKIPISVSYNPSLGIPKVVAVRLNAREVCPIKKSVRISPCPSVFLFDKVQNSTDKWSGVLSLKSEYELQGLWIRVTLDAAVTDLETTFGEVKHRDDNTFLIFKREHVLKEEEEFKIPIVVRYDSKSGVPNIKKVHLNARTICSSFEE